MSRSPRIRRHAPPNAIRETPLSTPITPRRRFLLVHNPIAGLARRPLLGDVQRALESTGASVVVSGKPPEDALAGLEGAVDAIIAAGGDGTIRALAAHAAARGVPIGILPVGTGNVLACEIGLSLKNARAIADVLLHGPVVEIEGAMANGEPFFLMAGAGFDGEVVQRLETPLKRQIGKAAYVPAVLGTLARPPTPLRVTIDGASRDARWAVVANARSYGGAFVMAPRASLLRPGLEVMLMRNMGRAATLRQLIALGLGRLAADKDVETIPATRSVEIEAAVPVATQVDGDPFGTTPVSITVGGPRLTLIVPPAYNG